MSCDRHICDPRRPCVACGRYEYSAGISRQVRRALEREAIKRFERTQRDKTRSGDNA